MLFTLSACRCLHSTLSCSSLTYSPGLHISTADPDSKGQLMAEQTISITLNGEAKEVAADQTGVQLFAEDKNIIAVRLNGEPRDLYTELRDGDVVEPIALDSEDGLAIMRHSATHVMAQAVQEIRPDAKLGVGPVIKDGFYYDFDVETPFTPDDLKEIEKRMQRIIKSSQSFRRRVVTEEEALAFARLQRKK